MRHKWEKGTTYTKHHPYWEYNPKGNHLYHNMYPKNRILQSVSSIQPYQPPFNSNYFRESPGNN